MKRPKNLTKKTPDKYLVMIAPKIDPTMMPGSVFLTVIQEMAPFFYDNTWKKKY